MNKREASIKVTFTGFRTENAAFRKWAMSKNGARVALRPLEKMFYLQKINNAKRYAKYKGVKD